MKYKILNDSILVQDQRLYQIQAVRNVGAWTDKDDIGGHIYSEQALDQNKGCWVCQNALILDKAIISDHAWVGGWSRVMNNAQIKGHAIVRGNSEVGGNSIIGDNALVNDYSIVNGFAVIADNAEIRNYAQINGNAVIRGSAIVKHNAQVSGNTVVQGNAVISGAAVLRGNDIITRTYQYEVIEGFSLPITITYASIHIGDRDFETSEIIEASEFGEVRSNMQILLRDELYRTLDKILNHKEL